MRVLPFIAGALAATLTRYEILVSILSALPFVYWHVSPIPLCDAAVSAQMVLDSKLYFRARTFDRRNAVGRVLLFVLWSLVPQSVLLNVTLGCLGEIRPTFRRLIESLQLLHLCWCLYARAGSLLFYLYLFVFPAQIAFKVKKS